jgi:crotonobetainyl-CoA hydratase
VQECLVAVNRIVAADDDVGWGMTDRALAAVMKSEDAREGVKAFLERRPPVWQGR